MNEISRFAQNADAILNERARYIAQYADSIPVHLNLDGRWRTCVLSELPVADLLREAFRLLLRAEPPRRIVDDLKELEREGRPA
jgi:hypothetical protein